MFSDNENVAIGEFKEFNESNDNCLNDIVSERLKLCDEEARLEILKVINGIKITQQKHSSQAKGDEVLQKVKQLRE